MARWPAVPGARRAGRGRGCRRPAGVSDSTPGHRQQTRYAYPARWHSA
ncbi:hypothetical protein GZL_05122 [Streptomyces sp. 769]|nr:hypothetical protein GZL_05122 [Streptomyces sp. 769]